MRTSLETTNAAHGAGPAGPRRVGLLRLVWACDWRLLRRDPGWWVAVALLTALLLASTLGMQTWLAQRSAEVQLARADEQKRLNDWQTRLLRIEQGAATVPEAPYRDPGNALYVGRSAAATVVDLPPAPLAALAAGVSDLWPAAFKVGSGSKDSYLFVDGLANPTQLLSGRFDPAFVLVLVLPLLIVVANAGLYPEEQAQGTLALTRSAPVALWRVLALKLLLRAGSVAATAALVCMGAVSFSAPAAVPWPALLLLGSGILAWGLFWAALVWAVNALRQSVAFNTLALAGAWLLIVVLLPALTGSLASLIHPAPSREDVVLAVRDAAVDAERDAGAERARFEQSHAGTAEAGRTPPAVSTAERTRLALAVTLAADARADQLLAAQDARLRERQALVAQAAWAVPSLLMQQWLADLAGSGTQRWQQHVQAVSGFHDQWQAFFLGHAQQGTRLTAADRHRLPRWQPTAVAGSGLAPSMLQVPLWLLALGLALFVWGCRRLQQVDPQEREERRGSHGARGAG